MKSAANRRRRTLVLGAIPVVLTGALVSIDRIPGTDISLTVPYAAEGPGPTVNTLGDVDGVQVVAVKAPHVYDTDGNLNMTTVSVRTNMTLAQAFGRWLFTDDTIVPIETVIPQNMTDEEVEQSNKQAFTESESAATVAAMNYLDLPLKIKVVDVLDGSPASGKIQKDDEVTAIDGEEVTEPGQVQDRIRAKQSGDSVEVSVLRGGKELTSAVTLGSSPADKKVSFLGLSMLSEPAEDITVDYNLQDIGGPSAGMMFTLAVIDKLSPGDLNGGKFVAGTGTIDESGTVGPIGGIEHKVRAAEEAGAQIFLAPADNCAEATKGANGDMVIAKVKSLQDATTAMDNFSQGKPVETCQAG